MDAQGMRYGCGSFLLQFLTFFLKKFIFSTKNLHISSESSTFAAIMRLCAYISRARAYENLKD